MKGRSVHDIINTLEDYFKSQLNKHKTNAKIMLSKPQSIPEHTDWIESIEKEIEKMAEYDEKLEMVHKHLKDYTKTGNESI